MGQKVTVVDDEDDVTAGENDVTSRLDTQKRVTHLQLRVCHLYLQVISGRQKDFISMITCNNLGYPWVPPLRSGSGYTELEWTTDKGAMDTRCTVIKLTVEHDEDIEVFPFTQDQWAQMLPAMHSNLDAAPEPTYKSVFE